MGAERTAPEVAEKFDDAKERLQGHGQTATEATEKARHKQPARYHVFRLQKGDDDTQLCWRWLTKNSAIQVLSLGRQETKKQEAIKAASSDLTPDELTGTFVAVREEECGAGRPRLPTVRPTGSTGSGVVALCAMRRASR
jgi:hypothetical protein